MARMLRARALPATCGASLIAGAAYAQPCTPHWSTEFATGPNKTVHAIHVRGSGAAEEIFVGGEFTQVGPLPAVYVARRANGVWSSLGTGLPPICCSPGTPGVYAFADFDTGSGIDLYAGGQIYVNGQGEGIARWDGAQWHGVGGGVAAACVDCPPAVFDLLVHDDGRGPALFLAGAFNRVGGSAWIPVGGVARWDGVAWDTLNGGPGGAGLVQGDALAVFDDGAGAHLYLSGFLSPAPALVRWNGRAWTHVTGMTAITCWDLEPFDDGRGPALYAAEFLSSGTGQVRRWDGAAWSSLGPVSGGSVLALRAFDDGAGAALYAGGAVPGGLARWSGSAWVPISAGVISVASLAVSGGSLLAGGSFTSAGGIPSQRLARWIGCVPCYPDCDASGALTIADFGCFQTKFAAADPYADCNQSGTWTIADFGCFQSKFAAGCP